MSKKTITTPFRLTENQRTFLKIVGDGNYSHGLHKLMEIAGYKSIKDYKKELKLTTPTQEQE